MDLQDRLRPTFFAEAEEILVELERAVLAMAERGDDSLMAEIFRQVHTLKGNATCLALEALTRASHHLEDALDLAIRTPRGRDNDLFALLLDGVDTLTRLVREAMAGVRPFDWAEGTVARVDAERRKQLPASEISSRSAWRDRRLMALSAHKRKSPKA